MSPGLNSPLTAPATSSRTNNPKAGSFESYHHVKWWCGNAKQAASYFVTRFGFQRVAYKGLETGSRNFAEHVIRQGDIFFLICSPLNDTTETGDATAHMAIHGDAVKDVAFVVDDVHSLFDRACLHGATPVKIPWTERDEYGEATFASIKTFGDTVHTLVDNSKYSGAFLPGFQAVTDDDPISKAFPEPGLQFIDHVVGNEQSDGMEATCTFYEKALGFHRFWSVDDNMSTEYSALRSIVMSSANEKVKMPINEPAEGKKKSQVEEFVDYNGNMAGVQHIALRTNDIIASVKALRARGVEFINVPTEYYTVLKERLSKSPLQLNEDFAELEKLSILIDFDENGYLLQLFSKNLMDRPTVFLELIQRENFGGFGAGNFKSLFEAIEREQESRGNL